jgi:hypothetical protein
MELAAATRLALRVPGILSTKVEKPRVLGRFVGDDLKPNDKKGKRATHDARRDSPTRRF